MARPTFLSAAIGYGQAARQNAITYLGSSTGLGHESSGIPPDDGLSITKNYTAPSDTDFLIVVAGFQESIDTDVLSATWNGVAMQSAVYEKSDGGGVGSVTGLRIFYLANPAVGAQDAVVAFGPDIAVDLSYVQVHAFKGLDSGSPPSVTGSYSFAFDGVTTSTDAVTVSTTTPGGDEVCLRIVARMTLISGATAAFTPGAGLTEIGDFQDAAVQERVCVAYNISTVSGAFNATTTITAGLGVATTNDVQVVAAFVAR